MNPSPKIALHSHLESLVSSYDVFLCDLWGVLHNGVAVFPAAFDVLKRLRAAGKKIGILSNGPRRSFAVADAIAKLGVSSDLYDFVMSSGEATHRALHERTGPFFAALGRNLYLLGPERDANLIQGLDFTRIMDIEAADFIVNTGPVDMSETLADYESLLSRARARDLPMICANPDLVVLRGKDRCICAGALAQRYQEMGGRVALRGKPDPAIFQDALAPFQPVDLRRVLMLGDSLRTDIAGAQNAGIDAIFIAGGIYAADLGIQMGETPDPNRLADLCAQYGVRPTAAMPILAW